ncbi:MAG TPA: bifunctional riboflavin kinase/FAD synthetase [Pseudonocardiaceae bacterium]|nr:bifunctional riboflavin kinase/FAD synthetase [Pseudonocardiaceae bacterium]
MQRWRGIEAIPNGWGRSVVTIGVFDGMHRGHVQMVGHAVQRAREMGVPSVLMTFDPHPSEVVRPGSHPAQLTTLRRRAELVEQLGVEVFFVLPFTVELSRVPADEFVHTVLVERLHVAEVVVGENFTFGHKAAGDIELLRSLGRRFGFTAEGVGLLSQGELTFSSTYIRSCIDAGDVAAAGTALGRPHRVEGIVVRGDQRGRSLGYPTANLSTPRHAAIPADGVYACRFVHRRRELGAAVSIGTNPTFSGRERRVEAYVLDLQEDFYGERVALDFVERLRGMCRFDTPEELVAQIDDDVVRTRKVLDRAG